LEPKIAKDLTVRGVDCIEFKPVNYPLFAAKVRGLVQGREDDAVKQKRKLANAGASGTQRKQFQEFKVERTMIKKQDIEAKLTQLTKILPISGIAIDIFNMTSSEMYENADIARAAGRDASLGVDILRMANSAFYNMSRKKIVNLVEAITHIGQKRVGELAIATNMMVALTPSILPWMDLNLTWHRSLCASVAIDHLAATRGISQNENTLFLSSICYPLGRIALCMLYPEQYQEMINTCKEKKTTLRDEERQYFSLSPEEVMGFLLKAWNIPSMVYEPLIYSSHTYSAVATLGEPLSTTVELLKIAILIAEIAVGRWELWDRIELPPLQSLKRLGYIPYDKVIAKTKHDAQELIHFKEDKSQQQGGAMDDASISRPSRSIYYCNLATESFDFLGEILAHSDLDLRECELDALRPNDPAILNCVGIPTHKFVTAMKDLESNPKRLILTDSSQTDNYSRFGRVLALPTSYSTLRTICHEIAKWQ
jgi:HD-like signal output (HDOD) protein